MLRAAFFAFASFVIFILLTDCSTVVLNSNTLNLAATIDDLAVRQIVYNLAKIKKNEWALPSQIQISAGQVSARTNVTPSVTSPLNSALTGTTQVASQVVAATGALTTTTTDIHTSNTPNAGASVGSTVEDVENWNVVPVQDPDQLRRLRLLYQYGAGQIRALDLLCVYPIPEIPDKATSQSAADKKKGDDDAAKGQDGGKPPPGKKYVRGYDEYSCVDIAIIPERGVKRMLIGPNPDPAFLNPPGCVLCAYPSKKFAASFKKGEKIYEGRASEDTVDADLDKYEYVPVTLNDRLLPAGKRYDYRHRQGHINWLFVVKDDEETPPEGATRIGSSNGYTVYTTNNQNFSEFVLAITEATLQSPELQKSVAAPPPLVQTNPR